MKNKLVRLIQSLVERGLPLPHAYDPGKKKPSFRLLAAYTSFLTTIGSLVALHFNAEFVVATAMSMLFFAICMVFYMLRRLESARIDLDDKEFSINSEKEVDKS